MSIFFGKNLSYLRDTFNINQTELSESINVNRTTISDYERGRSEPSLAKLMAIAEKFNIPADLLLGETIDLITYIEKRKNSGKGIRYPLDDIQHPLASDRSNVYYKKTKSDEDKERIIAAQEQTINSLSTTVAVLMDRIRDLEAQLRKDS